MLTLAKLDVMRSKHTEPKYAQFTGITMIRCMRWQGIAARHDWRIVSDTSYEGYTDIPRKVMQGYGVMTDEIFAQMPRDSFPTHVFIQGGVGGLAASICSYLWQKFDEKAPSIFVVEPDKGAMYSRER